MCTHTHMCTHTPNANTINVPDFRQELSVLVCGQKVTLNGLEGNEPKRSFHLCEYECVSVYAFTLNLSSTETLVRGDAHSRESDWQML